MAKGGPRPNSGRKRNATGVPIKTLRQMLADQDYNPFLEAVKQSKRFAEMAAEAKENDDVRLEAACRKEVTHIAVSLAPFVSPKLKSIEIKPGDSTERPQTLAEQSLKLMALLSGEAADDDGTTETTINVTPTQEDK